MIKYSSLAVVCTLCAVAACRMEDPTDGMIEAQTTSAQGDVTPVVSDGTRVAGTRTIDWATLQAEVAARADSTDRMLRKVPALSRVERTLLRRDVNAVQISRARQLGIPRNSDVDAMVKAGRLVSIADSDTLWTLYQLNFSVPYVTPATHELLTEIGTRFQARLDSLDVPRYRLVITSALRTADKQAALRRANSNASKIESAHEFGTTVDIAYRRFAPPLDPMPEDPALAGRDLAYRDSVMAYTANQRAAELQAVLGRILRDLKKEGKVLVMMERQQTVYHITQAQR